MMKAYLIVLLSVCTWPAAANLMALQIVDWQTPGDALVVRDFDNRLDWLRISVTRNASAAEIEAADYFDATGRAGFRWATQGDVSALFSHLSWHTAPMQTLTDVSADMEREGLDFHVLFGRSQPSLGLSAAGITQGMYRLPDGKFLAGTVIVGFAFNRPGGIFSRAVISSEADPIDNWTTDMRDRLMGAWLVRSIPEPATGWLCGAACLLLAAPVRLGLPGCRGQTPRGRPRWVTPPGCRDGLRTSGIG